MSNSDPSSTNSQQLCDDYYPTVPTGEVAPDGHYEEPNGISPYPPSVSANATSNVNVYQRVNPSASDDTSTISMNDASQIAAFSSIDMYPSISHHLGMSDYPPAGEHPNMGVYSSMAGHPNLNVYPQMPPLPNMSIYPPMAGHPRMNVYPFMNGQRNMNVYSPMAAFPNMNTYSTVDAVSNADAFYSVAGISVGSPSTGMNVFGYMKAPSPQSRKKLYHPKDSSHLSDAFRLNKSSSRKIAPLVKKTVPSSKPAHLQQSHSCSDLYLTSDKSSFLHGGPQLKQLHYTSTSESRPTIPQSLDHASISEGQGGIPLAFETLKELKKVKQKKSSNCKNVGFDPGSKSSYPQARCAYFHRTKEEWRARYVEASKRRMKCFSLKKYRNDHALVLAEIFLSEMERSHKVPSDEEISEWYNYLQSLPDDKECGVSGQGLLELKKNVQEASANAAAAALPDVAALPPSISEAEANLDKVSVESLVRNQRNHLWIATGSVTQIPAIGPWGESKIQHTISKAASRVGDMDRTPIKSADYFLEGSRGSSKFQSCSPMKGLSPLRRKSNIKEDGSTKTSEHRMSGNFKFPRIKPDLHREAVHVKSELEEWRLQSFSEQDVSASPAIDSNLQNHSCLDSTGTICRIGGNISCTEPVHSARARDMDNEQHEANAKVIPLNAFSDERIFNLCEEIKHVDNEKVALQQNVFVEDARTGTDRNYVRVKRNTDDESGALDGPASRTSDAPATLGTALEKTGGKHASSSDLIAILLNDKHLMDPKDQSDTRPTVPAIIERYKDAADEFWRMRCESDTSLPMKRSAIDAYLSNVENVAARSPIMSQRHNGNEKPDGEFAYTDNLLDVNPVIGSDNQRSLLELSDQNEGLTDITTCKDLLIADDNCQQRGFGSASEGRRLQAKSEVNHNAADKLTCEESGEQPSRKRRMLQHLIDTAGQDVISQENVDRVDKLSRAAAVIHFEILLQNPSFLPATIGNVNSKSSVDNMRGLSNHGMPQQYMDARCVARKRASNEERVEIKQVDAGAMKELHDGGLDESEKGVGSEEMNLKGSVDSEKLRLHLTAQSCSDTSVGGHAAITNMASHRSSCDSFSTNIADEGKDSMNIADSADMIDSVGATSEISFSMCATGIDLLENEIDHSEKTQAQDRYSHKEPPVESVPASVEVRCTSNTVGDTSTSTVMGTSEGENSCMQDYSQLLGGDHGKSKSFTEDENEIASNDNESSSVKLVKPFLQDAGVAPSEWEGKMKHVAQTGLGGIEQKGIRADNTLPWERGKAETDEELERGATNHLQLLPSLLRSCIAPSDSAFSMITKRLSEDMTGEQVEQLIMDELSKSDIPTTEIDLRKIYRILKMKEQNNAATTKLKYLRALDEHLSKLIIEQENLHAALYLYRVIRESNIQEELNDERKTAKLSSDDITRNNGSSSDLPLLNHKDASDENGSMYVPFGDRGRPTSVVNDIEEMINLETLHVVSEALMDEKQRILDTLLSGMTLQLQYLDACLPQVLDKHVIRVLHGCNLSISPNEIDQCTLKSEVEDVKVNFDSSVYDARLAQ